MANSKFSQIAAAPAPPGRTDTVIGVGPGPTDYRYTLAQIATGVLVQDTVANILLSSPASPAVAYATDLGVLLVADGTTWQIDSSYFVPQTANNDLGYIFSNRIGYGKDYITDKKLANCSVGFGSGSPVDGELRHGLAILDGITTQTFQIFQNNEWETIAANVALRDVETAENRALEHYPLNNWIQAFSGDSEMVGLNLLPTVQGYQVDLGAYPAPQQLNGGTF